MIGLLEITDFFFIIIIQNSYCYWIENIEMQELLPSAQQTYNMQVVVTFFWCYLMINIHTQWELKNNYTGQSAFQLSLISSTTFAEIQAHKSGESILVALMTWTSKVIELEKEHW